MGFPELFCLYLDRSAGARMTGAKGAPTQAGTPGEAVSV